MQVNTHKDNVARFNKIKYILVLIFVALFVYTTFQRLTSIYGINEYPVRAVAFLQKQNLNGNIFSDYNEGGYLIWKLPQKKVFIDGRMPSWRRSGNYPGESKYAFDDYRKMLSSEPFFKSQLQKYNINYILLPKIKPHEQTEVEKKNINIAKKFINLPPDATLVSQDLTKLGLIKIYDDGKFVIYKK